MKLAAAALLLTAACAARSAEHPALRAATPAVVAAREPARAAPEALAKCKLDAPRTTLQSSRPPVWVAGEEQQGPCETSDASPRPDELFTVHAAGPSGSGRYWEVLVSWRSPEGLRGLCLSTSSSGWRQIGADQQLVQAVTPLLRWSQDVDGDGQPELVLRSTLEFSEDTSLDETCLTASAYDRDGDGFVLDPGSTRALRAKLAQAYRTAAERPETQAAQRAHYARAAQRLEATSCAR